MLSLWSYSNMKVLLVVLIQAIAVHGQETVYGMQMPSFSSSSGPSGSSGGSRMSSAGMGWDSLGPSSASLSGGATGRGRVVSNSILDLDEPMEMENDNMEMELGQQPSLFPMMMTRPLLTGPSVGAGQMLQPTRMPGRNGIGMTKTSANSNGVSDNKVHRYVSVHVPPPDPILPPRMRPSLATPKPETHYQILFIKAPSTIPQEVQQIQLPPPPRMKTLVYVLLKKDSMSDLLKISQPPKVRPAKPEVFFIRYKGQKSQQSQDEKKPETGDMMINNDNTDINNNVNDSNEQGVRPRSTSTTTRPSIDGSTNRNMGMIQMQPGSGSGNRGVGMIQQTSGDSGPGTENRVMGMMQVSGGYGIANRGWGMIQPSSGSVPVNRDMGAVQSPTGSVANNSRKQMGIVQSSGGSGASNTGIQMGMGQALGGYDNAEIGDSDFSSDFNENQYLQAYRHQRHQNQRQPRSGFTFLPSRRYGIVN